MVTYAPENLCLLGPVKQLYQLRDIRTVTFIYRPINGAIRVRPLPMKLSWNPDNPGSSNVSIQPIYAALAILPERKSRRELADIGEVTAITELCFGTK